MTLVYKGEPKRGCGYRKLGGLYLVGDAAKAALPCQIMPHALLPCSCCGQTINFSRGYTWIKPAYFAAPCRKKECPAFKGCAFTAPNRVECLACDGEGVQYESVLDRMAAWYDLEGFNEGKECKHCQGTGDASNKVGLLWVGKEFYPESQGFIDEALALGVSKRLATVPRNLVLGKTWVMLAGKHLLPCPQCTDDFCEVCEGKRTVSAVFYAFKAQRLEMIVTEEMLAGPCPDCIGGGEPACSTCDTCDRTGAKPTALALRLTRQHITPIIVGHEDLEEEGNED